MGRMASYLQIGRSALTLPLKAERRIDVRLSTLDITLS